VAKIGQGGKSGHTQGINSVSWSPSDPFIFATASDDQSVRIWGTENMQPVDVIADSPQIKRVDLQKINGVSFSAAGGGIKVYS
jgi:WD40 repeat protein